MARVFSGIQPSGELHIGNWLGAIRNWVALQDQYESLYCIVDLHAITGHYDPATLAERTREMAIGLLAAGVDPARSILFVQSHVPAHTALAWLLTTITPLGELERMTQYKDKSQRFESIPAGLLSYPVLMAADILLYRADKVPVGDDQTQHLELAREIARRWNAHFAGGETFFPEPEPILSDARRIMGLDGQAKMSKSLGNTIAVTETAEQIWAKIRPAMTDPARKLRTDPGTPEICNLYTLHRHFSPPDVVVEVAQKCRTAGWGCIDCKRVLADNMVQVLAPLRERSLELAARPGYVAEILGDGAATARRHAAETMATVTTRMGFAPGGDVSSKDSPMLARVLKAAVLRGASDVHVKAGDVFRARVAGELIPLTKQLLTPQQTRALAAMFAGMEPEDPRMEALRDFDCSWGVPGVGRFRINVLRQRSSFMMVLRVIPFSVPTPEGLGLPDMVSRFAELDSGLVLVTGRSGSGKTSTVAAMVHHINRSRGRHVITLEDPIEYLHRDLSGSISQRELGTDTEDLATGLQAARRQDPDVIVISELRDAPSIDQAVLAAESDCLVLAAVTAHDTAGALFQLTAAMPPDQRDVFRVRLASALRAVVSQRMVFKGKGVSKKVVVEWLDVTPTARETIAKSVEASALQKMMVAAAKDGRAELFPAEDDAGGST